MMILSMAEIDSAVRASWAADTCSADDAARVPWTADNPAWGHCDVTALVGGQGDRALIPPDPGTFESYRQSG